MKRSLAVLLALMLAIGSMPTGVWAADSLEHADAEEETREPSEGNEKDWDINQDTDETEAEPDEAENDNDQENEISGSQDEAGQEQMPAEETPAAYAYHRR